MINFKELNNSISPFSVEAARLTRDHWNSIAKPIGSLGLLEEALVQIAGLTGSHRIGLEKRAVIVLCADNGVVEEGVTQTDASVTADMAHNISSGNASVCCMAKVANADIITVDIGMNSKVDGVWDKSVAFGTKNMTKRSAMTEQETERAILTGIELVKSCKERGYTLIATGEMGIGNTTTSSAIASVLLDLPVETVTGRGAGLSDEGMMRKRDAIRRAIDTNLPDKNNAFDVLCKLGGFDIAGMAGIFIGGAIYKIPILIDGVISTVAAFTASLLCPACTDAMIATHVSAEAAAKLLLEKLGKKPMLYAQMRLGEGTGAVAAMPLLDMALCVYNNMLSFTDAGIVPYEVMEQ